MKQALFLHAALTGAFRNLSGDTIGLRGKVSENCGGNVQGLTGDITGIYGDVTGIRGNLDACELTDEDRAAGVSIRSLVDAPEEAKEPAKLDNSEGG